MPDPIDDAAITPAAPITDTADTGTTPEALAKLIADTAESLDRRLNATAIAEAVSVALAARDKAIADAQPKEILLDKTAASDAGTYQAAKARAIELNIPLRIINSAHSMHAPSLAERKPAADAVLISKLDAQDATTYQRAKALAQERGVELKIINSQESTVEAFHQLLDTQRQEVKPAKPSKPRGISFGDDGIDHRTIRVR